MAREMSRSEFEQSLEEIPNIERTVRIERKTNIKTDKREVMEELVPSPAGSSLF